MESREIEELALKLYPIKIESIMEGTHDVNSYERNAFIKGVNYSLSLPPDKEVVSDEEIDIFIRNKFKRLMLKKHDYLLDNPQRVKDLFDGADWMRSRLSNVKEGEDYFESKPQIEGTNAVITSIETDKSEAVEFDRWKLAQPTSVLRYVGNVNGKSYNYKGEYYTIEGLYSIYKQSKTK